MKQALFFFLVLISVATGSWCQTPPQAFNYSTIIRGNNGQALPNKEVGLRFTIREGAGDAVYQESHIVTTSQIGLINLEIGNGEALSGSFEQIEWSNDIHFLEIELKDDKNGEFEKMGVVKFLSVPYAMYAGSAGTSHSSGTYDSDTSIVNELQFLSISNDTIYLSDGGFVKLPEQLSVVHSDTSNFSHYASKADTAEVFIHYFDTVRVVDLAPCIECKIDYPEDGTFTKNILHENMTSVGQYDADLPFETSYSLGADIPKGGKIKVVITMTSSTEVGGNHYEGFAGNAFGWITVIISAKTRIMYARGGMYAETIFRFVGTGSISIDVYENGSETITWSKSVSW